MLLRLIEQFGELHHSDPPPLDTFLAEHGPNGEDMLAELRRAKEDLLSSFQDLLAALIAEEDHRCAYTAYLKCFNSVQKIRVRLTNGTH